jgi:AraC family transcriptional regulator
MHPEARRGESKSEQPKPPPTRAPWGHCAGEGLVRVREYLCTACDGDPPESEQFERSSIAVVQSGVFGIRTDKRVQLLSAGFLLLGNPGQNYEASHDHGVGDRCVVFDFQGNVIEELAGLLRKGVGERPFAVNVLPPHPRADAFRRLAEERLASADSALGFEELGLALFARVLEWSGAGQARSRTPPRDGPKAREKVVAAITQIERASADDLHLADLAAPSGLDPFSFLRLFKRETGVTPYRFLLQTRLRRAIELLRDTARPITEIAYAVGFGDLSNFINAFRREVGVSPRAYRRTGPLAAARSRRGAAPMGGESARPSGNRARR